MQHCGFCALIGAPNAGKSTLTNRLTGERISIVSRKVQTTRTRIRAIAMEGETQIIFVDTPGIFAPRRKLDEAMVRGAWEGASDADCTVLLVDAHRGLVEEVRAILTKLAERKRPVLLALNKIDLIKIEDLLPLSAELNTLVPFEDTFMISAERGAGVDKLRSAIAARMPEGPWAYPEDQTADISLRFMAAEITREKLYDRLHQELPYASTVETDGWEERRDGSVKIDQTIYVQRDTQKRIVLGAKGQTIRDIGEQSRKDLEVQFGRRAHLFIFVKVRENWMEDPERLRAMGLRD